MEMGFWRMSNLKHDPGEIQDLSSSQPEVFADMRKEYQAYATQFGVLDMPEEYDVYKEMQYKLLRRVRDAAWPWAVGLVILIGIFLFQRRKKRRLKTHLGTSP